MNAAEAAVLSRTSKAEKSYEIQEALKQVKSAAGRGERQCWLTWKLNEDQAKYIRSLGYTLQYGVNNGTLTW